MTVIYQQTAVLKSVTLVTDSSIHIGAYRVFLKNDKRSKLCFRNYLCYSLGSVVYIDSDIRCCTHVFGQRMSVFHDEIEIEDMEYDEDNETYYYPCPCGDRFEITKVFKITLISTLSIGNTVQHVLTKVRKHYVCQVAADL